MKHSAWTRIRRAIQSLPIGGRFDLSEEEFLRRGRRVTLLEAMLWLSGISIALAMPYWFSFSPLLVVFYGSLGALLWRLSMAMSFKWAFLIAASVALVATVSLVAMMEK